MNLFLHHSPAANKISFFFIAVACCLSAASCSAQKQIAKSAATTILDDTLFQTAHIGIAVYDAAANKFLYNHQGEHYFIPASNTKIITCYAVMKYLGDSLEGMRYYTNSNNQVTIIPTGDPTFLHPDFSYQPVYNFLSVHAASITGACSNNWNENALGFGWSWDDYNDDYMAERSLFPVYGNVATISNQSGVIKISPFTFPLVYGGVKENEKPFQQNGNTKYNFKRTISDNIFLWDYSDKNFTSQQIPFITSDTAINRIIKDTIKNLDLKFDNTCSTKNYSIIHSQPVDSLLKIMMHRSDNFFAEQSLLMISNKLLGTMNDEKIIDTLLNTDFKEMPQPPRWVDGSGLSRYNLFSPQDFVFVLNKMRNEFLWQRITTIFPTGGTGTLGSRYKHLEGKIFAKTGSLSNNATFSGYLITQSGKTLIFSIMVNNYIAEGSKLRNDMMHFLTRLYEKY